MRFIIVSILATVAFAAPQKHLLPELDGRIIGGGPVEIKDYPHQISLQHKSHKCGGSIISETHVVTAAHCTFGHVASELSVRAGSSIHSDDGQVVKVKTIHQHPNYDKYTIDFDVSVLELETALDLGLTVQPINLTLSAPSPGTEVVVIGWGLTDDGAIPSQLQAVKVQTISKEDCNKIYGRNRITERMLCAAGEDGKDACQRDDGGPLLSNGELAGIVSWGKGCGSSTQPRVYTDVASVRHYIVSKANL